MEETKETVNTQGTDTKSAAGSNNTQNNQIPGYTLETGVKMKPCKYCRVMVPKKAKICPNCKKKIRKNWLGFLVFLLVIALLAGGGAYYYLYLYEPAPALSTAVSAVAEEPAEKETVPAEASENTATSESAAEDTTAESTAKDTTTTEAATGDTAAAETISQTTTTDTQKDSAVTANATEAESAEALIQPLTEENTTAAEKTDAANTDETNNEAVLESPLDVAETEESAQEEETQEIIDPAAYSETDFRALCTSIDFRKLMRTPDVYLNQCLTLEATILAQVDGGLFDENSYYLVSAEDRNGVQRYYILRDDRGEDAVPLFEGDVIVIYGQMFATGKVPVEYGIRNNKVPAISIVYCDLKEE